MPTPKEILDFYQSKKWKRVRRLKRQLARGVCEKCGKGGWEVHHKTAITLANLANDNITCGLDNLELLCTSCHNAQRASEGQVRKDITFDRHGNVVQKQHPPTP